MVIQISAAFKYKDPMKSALGGSWQFFLPKWVQILFRLKDAYLHDFWTLEKVGQQSH